MRYSAPPSGLINILISYAYINPNLHSMIEALQGSAEFMLDSGGFTAFKQGKVIDFDRYCEFVRDHGDLFWEYVQLDSIGNPGVSSRYLLRMVERGLHPMPVFVLGEDEATIDAMAQINRRICVGGGVTETDAYYGDLLERLWRRLDGNVGLHGLGFTRGTKVLRTKVSTVDSSTWMTGMRWAAFTWFDRLYGNFRNKPFRDMRRRPFSKLPPAMQKILIDTGVTAADLGYDVSTNTTLSLISVQCSFAWLQFAATCAERDVRFFFASPTRGCLVSMFVAARNARRDSLDWRAAREQIPEVRAKLYDDKWLAGYVAQAAVNLRSVYGEKIQGR